MASSRYVGDMCQSWHGPKRKEREEEIESKVKVCNKINITQKGIAYANGGNGGDANGGNNNTAAAAADKSAAVVADVDIKRKKDDYVNKAEEDSTVKGLKSREKEEEEENKVEAEAGNGGKGGDGGNGGTADVSQSIDADIYNITVVVNGIDSDIDVETDGPSLKKKAALKINKGEVFVNGEKVEPQVLKDGTKVYVSNN